MDEQVQALEENTILKKPSHGTLYDRGRFRKLWTIHDLANHDFPQIFSHIHKFIVCHTLNPILLQFSEIITHVQNIHSFP